MMTAQQALTIESPLGPLRLVAGDNRLTAIEFLGEMSAQDLERKSTRRALTSRADAVEVSEEPAGVLAEASAQLAEYFAGRRTDFDLPLRLEGTEFQRSVWGELQQIPYGATSSYGELARALGKTGHGSRAVGAANGRNPIPIVVPCHRVVGANGALTGYGGGMSRKVWLLELEGAALGAH